MSEVGRYVRPPSAESRGEAPGRGRLQGRKVLVVGGGQRIFDAATAGAGGLQDVQAWKVNGVRTERADGERWSSRRTTS
jgi:hypothetical protein